MGFKANIDIALSFSNLKICSIKQQGRIKFRVCLYYTCNKSKNVFVCLRRKRIVLTIFSSVTLIAYSEKQDRIKVSIIV